MANNAYDNYMNRRSWLIDTAETPADKKKLKAELAKLDAKYKEQIITAARKNMTVAQKVEVARPNQRSNQPRVGTRLEEDQQDAYHFAVEVAGQPAETVAQKSAKKRAEATARNFERRFPSLSERKTAGVKTTTSTVNKTYRPMGN